MRVNLSYTQYYYRGTSHVYYYIYKEEKQGFTLLNKCPVLFPIVPIVKLVKIWALLEN